MKASLAAAIESSELRAAKWRISLEQASRPADGTLAFSNDKGGDEDGPYMAWKRCDDSLNVIGELKLELEAVVVALRRRAQGWWNEDDGSSTEMVTESTPPLKGQGTEEMRTEDGDKGPTGVGELTCSSLTHSPVTFAGLLPEVRGGGSAWTAVEEADGRESHHSLGLSGGRFTENVLVGEAVVGLPLKLSGALVGTEERRFRRPPDPGCVGAWGGQSH